MSNGVHLPDRVRRLRGLDFGVCRILPGDKLPLYKGWTHASLEPADFERYHNPNVGILAGRLSGDALILDPDRPEIRAAMQRRFPRTMTDARPSSSPGHLYYRVTDIPEWATAGPHVAGGLGGPRIFHFTGADGKPIGLDVLGTGSQAVAPPSLHHSGERRFWLVEPERILTLPYLELWPLIKQLAVDFGAVNVDRETDAAARPARFVSVVSFRHHAPGTFSGQAPGAIRPRAAAYLAKCPPAVSGSGGHSRTFAVARAIVWGMDLGAEAGFDLLQAEYNPRCQPPWSDAELLHKCEQADTVPCNKPRGWLLLTDHGSGRRRHGRAGRHATIRFTVRA